ncbi:MAG TPA: ABC transporter substrate-binding protein [Steroidobacteraceae bacterium]|jgi:ABC-type nitrate/sulfonate/bicarbonate transport system substrate-binding protein|nr:ABC transporter substrate-binding protein [Steroidobacteraceae bacterium]
MPDEIHIIDAGGPHELATVELLHRQGYLERLGVRCKRTYIKNGAEATELLLAGQGDAAMQIGFGPAVAAVERGAPLRIIAGSNMLTVHAIYAKDPEIRRLRDLAGRTVGIGARGALTHQLIFAALRKHGIDPASIEFVSIGNSATIFQALLAGEVDAGFGETEVFEHQARYGVHALHDAVLWRELPEFPNQASFATDSAIRERRDAVVRTLAAHAQLYRFLQSPLSRETYARAWAAALPGTDPAEGRTQWLFYQQNRPFSENLLLSAAQIRYIQELNVAMGLQHRVLPGDLVADLSLARDALELIDGQGGTSLEAHKNG